MNEYLVNWLTVLVLCLHYLNIGYQIPYDVLAETFKKPIVLLVAFVCQLVITPLLAFGMVETFLTDPMEQLGLFLVACAPGVHLSNLWTLMFGGNLTLSIVITLVSLIATFGALPTWTWIIGNVLIGDTTFIQIPYIYLFVQVTPFYAAIAAGIALNYYKGKYAEKTAIVIKPISILLAIASLAITIYLRRDVLSDITWAMVGASMITSWSGYLLAAVTTIGLRFDKRDVITIVIQTGFQNGALVVTILLNSLSGNKLNSALAPVASYLLTQSLPLFIGLIFVKVPRDIIQSRRESARASLMAESNSSFRGVWIPPNSHMMTPRNSNPSIATPSRNSTNHYTT